MAILFGGTAGDHIQTGYAGIQGANARSVMCWLEAPGGNVDTFISWGTASGLEKSNLEQNTNPSGEIIFHTGANGAVGATTYDINGTHHLCGKGSGDASSYTLFLNGVDDTSSAAGGTLNTTTGTNVRFGASVDGSGAYNKTMYDARIYDRELTANEVQTIHACQGTDAIYAGLTGRWPMNDRPSGTTVTATDVKDVSNNKNNSTGVTGTHTFQETRLRKRKYL